MGIIKEELVSARATLEHLAYTSLAKPIFFRQDPEAVHNQISTLGTALGGTGIGRAMTSLLFNYTHPALTQTIAGMDFANPTGLSAGFDKNGHLTKIIPAVGFGFMEVGTVTLRPCLGNPKPRLHRLTPEKSLLVNYGLRNDGAAVIAKRLSKERFDFPVGISIAPTNDARTADCLEAISEYAETYRQMGDIANYITLNLSCPNTAHSQPFMEAEKLDELLQAINEQSPRRPLFLKLSPDVTNLAIEAILLVAEKRRVDGLIISNLTKESKEGGISGKVLEPLANKMLEHVARESKGKFILVGCGGVFSAADAYRKIGLGASLIQLITGMIYEGPQLIGHINQGLVKLLKRDGFASISEAMGKDL